MDTSKFDMIWLRKRGFCLKSLEILMTVISYFLSFLSISSRPSYIKADIRNLYWRQGSCFHATRLFRNTFSQTMPFSFIQSLSFDLHGQNQVFPNAILSKQSLWVKILLSLQRKVFGLTYCKWSIVIIQWFLSSSLLLLS